MPAIIISTTKAMASIGDNPRIRISSRMPTSSTESGGRSAIASNVRFMYLIAVLIKKFSINKPINYFFVQ